MAFKLCLNSPLGFLDRSLQGRYRCRDFLDSVLAASYSGVISSKSSILAVDGRVLNRQERLGVVLLETFLAGPSVQLHNFAALLAVDA